uniref:Uncharacterized protein n=1 Tax=Arundo donax TaxID=35708 RepID=A0A0A8YG74_ARUDO
MGPRTGISSNALSPLTCWCPLQWAFRRTPWPHPGTHAILSRNWGNFFIKTGARKEEM